MEQNLKPVIALRDGVSVCNDPYSIYNNTILYVLYLYIINK